MVKNEQEQVSSNFGQGSGEQSGKPAGDDCGAVAGEFCVEALAVESCVAELSLVEYEAALRN